MEYSGKRLRPFAEYWWSVRVWDRAGRPSAWSKPARWSMGPLSDVAWGGSWIEDSGAVTGTVPAHNGYHSQPAESADVTKWVQVDLGSEQPIDGVRLWPARPFDWQADVPGFLFPLRYRIETSVGSEGPWETALDHEATDSPSPGTDPVLHRFASRRGRYLRLTATRLRMRDQGYFGLALAEMEVLSGEANVGLHRSATAADSIEQPGWSTANLTNGDTTSHPAHGGGPYPAPMMRKPFGVAQKVRRATAYVSALGLVELRINGRKASNNLLAPEWTDYRTRVQYQAYDVTNLVRTGANVVAAWLGDGWYAGRIGLFPNRANYGPKPRLRVNLRLEMADGSVRTVVTDGTWRSTTQGPIRIGDILDGEVYEANREMPGWDAPGFRDAGWTGVSVVRAPGPKLVWQRNEPIAVVEQLAGRIVGKPAPDTCVFDMGQNMVGHARIRLSGKPGDHFRIRHAEMLNDDGTVYVTNLRGAPQTDWVTLGPSGTLLYEPRFTYHGFRYLEIQGPGRLPADGDVTGQVFCSSSPQVSTFECSSKLVNQIMHNVFWTQRANLMSTPTDCPQRDERLGWMGDIQSFGQSAVFNMDMAAFFTKWLCDVRDAQMPDGRFPDFAPNPAHLSGAFTGVPAWGDAGVVVPWRAWQNYGDRRLIEESYPSCRKWIDYIHGLNRDLVWRNGRNADYNDWLNGDTLINEGWPRQGGAIPNEVFATAFFAHSTDLTSRMAAVLGRKREAEELHTLFQGIKEAFNREFVGQDGTIKGDTQAGYALALHFDLLPNALRPAAVARMVAAIHRYKDHISTGIQSTHRMMMELTREGEADLAYKLLNQTDFPSWGFMVQNGATTIWERWDGYVKGRGFQDPGMNSFNHWALGSVAEWVWRTVAGLNPSDSAPGWRHFTVKPIPGGGLTWAKASYHSQAGTIAVDWRVADGKFVLDLTVPANTTADVVLPGRPVRKVGSGTYRFETPMHY